MIKAGVLGNPINHSKSPRLHNHWLEILGINGVYERIEAPLDGFTQAVKALQMQGYAGCNVTIPFKEEARALADDPSGFVKQNGASNTLVFHDEKIEAHNTDGYGFAQNILAAYPDWNFKGDHIVLGAGGAAKAIVAWLLNAGANSVLIVNRSLERAEALAQMSERFSAHSWEALPDQIGGKATLINTTSLGMNGQNDIEIDLTNADKSMIVNDIVYTPLETGLLRDAKAQGLRAVDGLGMLLWQARPGFQAWFGAEPPAIDQGLRNLMLSEKVIGLTGSIGMGKSTVSKMFADFGFQIWEADEEVHKLYAVDFDLHEFIKNHCPDAMKGGFQKSVWRDYVFAHPDIFSELEALIHRKIVQSRRAFLESDAPLKLCDIPLLFETGRQNLYDAVITVSAPADVQKQRVLERGTMSEAQFEAVLKKQISDDEKRARADYVIENGGSLENTQAQLRDILKNWGLL